MSYITYTSRQFVSLPWELAQQNDFSLIVSNKDNTLGQFSVNVNRVGKSC